MPIDTSRGDFGSLVIKIEQCKVIYCVDLMNSLTLELFVFVWLGYNIFAIG